VEGKSLVDGLDAYELLEHQMVIALARSRVRRADSSFRSLPSSGLASTPNKSSNRLEEMRSLPPRTIVPLTLPRTLSHRSGSIMIAGPFVGTLAPGQPNGFRQTGRGCRDYKRRARARRKKNCRRREVSMSR